MNVEIATKTVQKWTSELGQGRNDKELPPPTVRAEMCAVHELTNHYCNRTIWISTEIDHNYNNLAHEFWHYVFDLCRRGEFELFHEESFVDHWLTFHDDDEWEEVLDVE